MCPRLCAVGPPKPYAMHFPSDLHSDSPDDGIALPCCHRALPPSTTHKASAHTCCYVSFMLQLTGTSALIICYMIYHILQPAHTGMVPTIHGIKEATHNAHNS